ncbi:MAG: hypothetical protein JNJ69_09380, partial [Leptospiraceae bacterium]|nr:hypothetical protein [Leptospiraceae bacterium]
MSKGTILCRALLMSLVCGCKSFGKESNVKNRQHLSPENITAFAIKAEIPVKSKPNRTAKTLDLWRVNLVAKVLNLNMPDDEGDSAPPWIEIQYQSMGKTILGFVSTEEGT